MDCCDGLDALEERPRLVIADPPYNLGQPYEDYHDKKPHDEYLDFTERWMSRAVEKLHDHGSLWVFAPDEWVSEMDVMARKDLGLYKRRHIVWAFTFGQASQNNFSKSHCHILYFVKTKSRFTFNEEVLRVPSARQAIYGDKRANGKGKLPDATWMLLRHQLEPYMTPDKDTWLVSRVCGTFNERAKHSPNQIPLPIMVRIVRACSNVGDLVVDLFAGTGSSGVACATYERRWVGYDVSATCVKKSQARVDLARKEAGF
jgi:site-specific DNA-methyltransferase (adenine-specific)